MNLLGHSAQEIQNHLYQAFLSGDAADISVRIGGSWNAEYKLHRLVLTQAVSSDSWQLTSLTKHLGILSVSLHIWLF